MATVNFTSARCTGFEMMKTLPLQAVFLVLGVFLGQPGLAAVEVGEVAYSRGVLTGQIDGGR